MTALVMLENREGVLPMVFLALVLGACSPEANIGRFTTTADQIRSLQSVPAVLLESFRVCFGRSSTFDRWERYLLGLLADLKRKSIEPIALATGAKVRTLQEFLSAFEWDHERVNKLLQQRAMDKHGSEAGIAGQAAHASKRVDNVCRYGPAFRDRDWLCSRMAMLFPAEQTERLRREKSADHAGAGGGGGRRLGHGHPEPQLARAV